MKVHLDSVGCRLNQSEIESYARHFRAAGHRLVPKLEEADVFVLNSCAVTQSAVSDSRQKVRRAEKLGVQEIVVTGCWSDIEKDQVRSLPGVSRVVPNQIKDTLVADYLNIPLEEIDLEPIARTPIPGGRLRTRAYIKVQDGCDNRCTFCVTTLARGASRSRSVEQIRRDIFSALDGGSKEIVLTGVHLGSWGYDFEEKQHLSDLIRQLLSIDAIPRLRISSLEPWDLDEQFFDLWQDARLCRHLHLPLQSGSAATLKRMARNTTPAKFSRLVSAARKAIPALAITTDVIVGFPGEREQEFSESYAFVKEMEFADAHVFTYSERQGTAAAKMPHPVQNGLRKQRNQAIRELVRESGAKYRRGFLGMQLDVLWESEQVLDNNSVHAVGLTDNYLRVETLSPGSIWNELKPVRLSALTATGMRGALSNTPESIWFD